MKTRNSEIFNEFVKIAEEKGMIDKDAPEKAINKLKKNPRHDSLDISAIEALYGVKPNSINEYKNNIMEAAHPNSVVLSPAHDKLNGLVENNMERQNIILNIVNKNPNGLSTQHKYAKGDLILSLVKLGNELDSNDNEQLRKLADVCLDQVSIKKKLKKKAAFPLVIGGIAALIGALYAHQHLSNVDQGFEKNNAKLIAEINDLINASKEWGVGYNLSTDVKTDMQNLVSKLNNFYSIYSKIKPIFREIERPKTKEELQELAAKPEGMTLVKASKVLRSYAESMLPFIQQIEKNFKSSTYKEKMIEDKGWMTELVDKTQILHGGAGLIADDFDDVVHAISPYVKSLTEMLQVLNKSESLEQDAKNKMQEASLESEKQFGTPVEKSAPSGPTFANEPDLDKDDEEIKSIL